MYFENLLYLGSPLPYFKPFILKIITKLTIVTSFEESIKAHKILKWDINSNNSFFKEKLIITKLNL